MGFFFLKGTFSQVLLSLVLGPLQPQEAQDSIQGLLLRDASPACESLFPRQGAVFQVARTTGHESHKAGFWGPREG